MIPLVAFLAALLLEGLLLCALLAWREHEHTRTQRDLLNRLMARDLGEYRVASEPPGQANGRRRNPVLARLEQQRTQDQQQVE